MSEKQKQSSDNPPQEELNKIRNLQIDNANLFVNRIPCPSCGYCPTCGRHYNQFNTPYYGPYWTVTSSHTA